MKKALWNLKIFNGIHGGAEIPLCEGEFTIGKGETCDLVLHDSFMAELAGKLRVNKEGVQLLSQLDKNDAIDEKYFEENKPFWVGELKVGIFRHGDEWVEIPTTADNETGIDDLLADPSQANPAEPTKTSGGGVRKILGAVAIGLIGFGAYYYLSYRDDSSVLSSSPQKNQQQLPASVVIDQDAESRLVVSGYLTDSAAKKKLYQQLSNTGKTVVLNMKLQSDLVKATQISLNLQKIPGITASAGEKPSTVKLTGYSDNITQWSKAKENLARDIKGVLEWEDLVETKTDRVAALQKMIVDKKLSKNIQLRERPGNIQILGAIPPEKVSDWKDVESSYNSQFQKKPPLSGSSTVIKGLQIRAVSMGDVPHIITDNGDKLVAGARIDAGITLHQVLEDKIIVKKDGSLVTHYFK